MRRHAPFAVLLFASTALTAGTLAARPLEKELPPNRAACFERIYDAAHLTAHPRQEVTRIQLSQEASTDAKPGEEEQLFLSVEINVRGKPGPYVLGGFCKAQGKGLLCEPEWEAGSFKVEAAPDGTLLVTNNSMTFNPHGYDAEEVAPGAIQLKGDDRAWKLSRGGPQCGKADGAPSTAPVNVPNPR